MLSQNLIKTNACAKIEKDLDKLSILDSVDKKVNQVHKPKKSDLKVDVSILDMDPTEKIVSNMKFMEPVSGQSMAQSHAADMDEVQSDLQTPCSFGSDEDPMTSHKQDLVDILMNDGSDDDDSSSYSDTSSNQDETKSSSIESDQIISTTSLKG